MNHQDKRLEHWATCPSTLYLHLNTCFLWHSICKLLLGLYKKKKKNEELKRVLHLRGDSPIVFLVNQDVTFPRL